MESPAIRHSIGLQAGKAIAGEPTMSANLERITVTIKLTKETKNTYRYDAVDDDSAVSNLYIHKKTLPNGAPQELEVRLTAG